MWRERERFTFVRIALALVTFGRAWGTRLPIKTRKAVDICTHSKAKLAMERTEALPPRQWQESALSRALLSLWRRIRGLAHLSLLGLVSLGSNFRAQCAPSSRSMWPFSSTCKSRVRLIGKTVIITGANTGIGKETARDLYRRGARVILACRNLEKANAAAEEVRKIPPSKPERDQFLGKPGELVVYKLNLASLASVRECAKTINASESRIDLLINNAGVMMCPQEKTEDGYEMQLQSNHLGHFLLTMLLMPKIIESAPGCRIVNVSSLGHVGGQMNFEDLNMEKSYSPVKAYAQSKLANILFTKELARKLQDASISGVTTYCLHPGVISTELGRHLDSSFFPGSRMIFQLFKPFIKTPELGAQTTIHCAVDENAANETGLYYRECKTLRPASQAENEEDAKKLWMESLKLVGLPPKENFAELIKVISSEVLPSL